MPVKRSMIPLNFTLAAPTRPLGLADLRFVEESLGDVAPGWSVDLHGTCADEASLVLLPEGGDDAMGPSFIISRDDLGFRVDQLHWDVMQEIGMYSELGDAVAAVAMRLSCGSLTMSATVH
jgi:hypothetical protein